MVMRKGKWAGEPRRYIVDHCSEGDRKLLEGFKQKNDMIFKKITVAAVMKTVCKGTGVEQQKPVRGHHKQF